MQRTKGTFFALCILVSAALVVSGCSRDPNVRKQKFLAQGNADSDKGKCPEAIVSYNRALQIDPRFTEAHFKLAQCYLKIGSFPTAYQELMRTVDLQPDHWKAQLEIAKMLMAGGKVQGAKDRALLILKSNPTNFEAQVVLSQADTALKNDKQGLEEAKDAITMSPDHSGGYLNLAMLEEHSGAFGEA